MEHAWIQLIEGDLDVNGEKLSPGDGVSTDEVKEASFCVRKGRAFSVVRPQLTFKQIKTKRKET